VVTLSRRKDVVRHEHKEARLAKIREQSVTPQELSLCLDTTGAHPTASIPPKLSFLVVCEGKKTEPYYIKALKSAWRLIAEIKTVGAAGAPHKLIDAAISHEKKGVYDRVWVVFDKDDFRDIDITAAFRSAKKERIQIAFSNECFELWLLMHFQRNKLNQGRQGLIKSLNKYLPNYDKNITPDHLKKLLPCLHTAVRHAESLTEKVVKKNKEAVPQQPYTTVHLLVRDLTTSSSRLPTIQKEIRRIFPIP